MGTKQKPRERLGRPSAFPDSSKRILTATAARASRKLAAAVEQREPSVGDLFRLHGWIWLASKRCVSGSLVNLTCHDRVN